MANMQINAYTAASSIDAANDYFLIDPGGTGNYKKINRNTIMVVTGTPADISSTQNFTNKTLNNTNTITSKAANFTLQDGADTTKQANFVLSSISTSTTRNVTLPDSNTTLPIISQPVTFSGPTAARTYTLADSAVTIADTSTVQTLTNKTLTSSTDVLGGVTMTLGSDASGDVYYRNSSGVLTRVASVGSTNQVLTMGASSVPQWSASTSQMTLLKANSGTDTSAGATNVDTYAISGLTAKDTLKIYLSVSSVTQATGVIYIYSTTDSTGLTTLNNNAILGANSATVGELFFRQSQQSNVVYDGGAISVQNMTIGGSINSSGVATASSQTFATAWTGSWTIALRHSGVTAGGTFRWSWSLYKVAGQ